MNNNDIKKLSDDELMGVTGGYSRKPSMPFGVDEKAARRPKEELTDKGNAAGKLMRNEMQA